jgi:hypothetical protein
VPELTTVFTGSSAKSLAAIRGVLALGEHKKRQETSWCWSNEEAEVSLASGVVVRLRRDNQRALFVLRPVRKDEILIFYDGPLIDHPTRYSIQIDDNLHLGGTRESNACYRLRTQQNPG